MGVTVVLAASILLQFTAAVFALRLIGVTRRRMAWTLIALAISMMAVRRCITLYRLLSGDVSLQPDVFAELVALAISVLMFVGVALIFPVFYSLRRSQEELRESHNQFRTLSESSPSIVFRTDAQGMTTYVNRRWSEMSGLAEGKWAGSGWADAIYEEDRQSALKAWQQAVAREEIFRREIRFQHTSGRLTSVFVEANPIRNDLGEVVGYVGVAVDGSERIQAEQKLQARVLQQAAVAELGQIALAGEDLDSLMNEIVRRVAKTMNADYCNVLELLEDGDSLLLRAGVGWQAGLVGTATVSANSDSQAGYALQSSEPVIVEALPAEKRFSGTKLLIDHCVISGMSVIVQGVESPWGVLGVHTTQLRSFNHDDMNFLQAAANVLAEAIARKNAERQAERRIQRLQELAHLSMTLSGDPVEVIQEIARMLGDLLDMRVVCLSEVRGQDLCFLSVYANGKVTRNAGKCDVNITPCAKVLQSKEIQIYDNVSQRFPKATLLSDHRANFYCGFPSFDSDGAVVCVACLLDDRPRQLSEEDEALLRVVAQRIGAEFERREHLQQQRLAEQQFGDLLESSPDTMLIVDKLGHIVFANAQTETLFGYARREILGQPIEMLLPLRFRERHVPIRDRFLSDPNVRSMSRLDLLGLRKNGVEFPVEISLSPIETARGKLVAASVRDVTQRKLAQQELLQAHAELEKRVQQRTVELSTANRQLLAENADRLRAEEDLRSSNEELESFAHSVSHDLKAPLRAISGFTEALQDEFGDTLDETADRYMRRISSGVTRMEELINDLLEHARLGRGLFSLGDVDLNQVIDEVREQLAPEIEASGAEIIVEEPLGVVKAHRVTLTLAMQNLIGNALKFVSPDRVPQIRISAESDADTHRISISDNGIGIDPKYHEMIWGIFERLHTNEQYPGTGIGLAIVKKAAGMHRGKVFVESEPGMGSTFHFHLSRQLEKGEVRDDRPKSKYPEGAAAY